MPSSHQFSGRIVPPLKAGGLAGFSPGRRRRRSRSLRPGLAAIPHIGKAPEERHHSPHPNPPNNYSWRCPGNILATRKPESCRIPLSGGNKIFADGSVSLFQSSLLAGQPFFPGFPPRALRAAGSPWATSCRPSGTLLFSKPSAQ